jgi:hypothetical protein
MPRSADSVAELPARTIWGGRERPGVVARGAKWRGCHTQTRLYGCGLKPAQTCHPMLKCLGHVSASKSHRMCANNPPTSSHPHQFLQCMLAYATGKFSLIRCVLTPANRLINAHASRVDPCSQQIRVCQRKSHIWHGQNLHLWAGGGHWWHTRLTGSVQWCKVGRRVSRVHMGFTIM